jgi:hypothetical protein
MSAKVSGDKGVGSNDSQESKWDSAIEDAKKVGIEWERPADDKRTAEEIVNDSPILKTLGNEEKVRDTLREQVSDHTNHKDFLEDADAVYRAVQVLEHIERFDSNGNRLAGKQVGNGDVDGFTSSNQARHGTEAGRLKDFGKFGFSFLKGNLGGSETAGGDKKAQAEAEKLGIQWERPKGDDRSASDILDKNPLLKNLGNQSGVKDMLKERVGDYEKDADAAYRAVQVLEHIEKLDANGNRIASKNIDNGKIDGFTSSKEARPNSEAGRLQDFGKEGFSALKGKLDNPKTAGDDKQAKADAEKLGIKWERPEGDDRSAEDILNSNPLLKNLGNQSGVKDMLKEQVGDYETDADAAYRAAQVLQHIEQFDGDGKRIVGNSVGDGNVNGFTNSREAKPDTEAGRLQDFGKEGFSALKGKLDDVSAVGDDKKAREEAEKVGIVWERPEDDKRSASDILDDNPLLKNLGNQSGVKDMLKERVGDYETDADAAFRAVQVLDRVTMYDEKGNARSDKSAYDNDVNGFTKGREAEHGSEAGRLQDFGKQGFSALPTLTKSEDIKAYKGFLKANPDADETSKTIARYAALLEENFEVIKGSTGAGDYLTADSLKEYKEQNTHLSDEVKQALDFWAQPGTFEMLDNAKHPLSQKGDGDVSKNDLNAWLKDSAPKGATDVIDMLKNVATNNLLSDVDTSKLGKDVFDNPDKYSGQEKAAVLKDLVTAQQLIAKGGEAGMWKDDKSIVTIANKLRSHPDPTKLLADVNRHISILQADPDVSKYMSENGAKELDKLLGSNEQLKDSLEKTYKEDIKSGKALDELWATRTKEGASQQSILAEFASATQSYADALGIDSPKDLQEAVAKSEHKGEFEDYYKDWLASGDRLTELLNDYSFEEASSVFNLEVAVYNSALDPKFTEKLDDTLQASYTEIAQREALDGLTFDALKEAYGVDGTDELDEEKVKDLIENLREENPQFLLNQDGTVTDAQMILTGIRGAWDMMRNGTKFLDKGTNIFKGDDNVWKTIFKGSYDKGAQHAVSGMLMGGLTIYNATKAGANMTEKDKIAVVTGSVQTTTLLIEGGSKGYQTYLKDAAKKLSSEAGNITGNGREAQVYRKIIEIEKDLNKQLTETAKKFENSAKGFGGAAGAAIGAYSIYDGVKQLRAGDKLSGGLSITAGSVGAMAGLAGMVEGGVTLLGASEVILSRLGAVSGALGWVSAGVGAVALIVPTIVNEVKQENRVRDFSNVLDDYLADYGIDGVENGDYWDIPDADWEQYA